MVPLALSTFIEMIFFFFALEISGTMLADFKKCYGINSLIFVQHFRNKVLNIVAGSNLIR